MNHLIGLNNNQVRSGNFSFLSSVTQGPNSSGLGFATFLLGDVSSFNRTVTQNTNAQERQKRLFFYAGDQWRATQTVTVNYGLRWEMYFPESVTGKGLGGLLDLNTATFGSLGTDLGQQPECQHGVYPPVAANRCRLAGTAEHSISCRLRARLWYGLVG